MIAVTSPLTGELLREVPIRTAEEVATAVERARGGQDHLPPRSEGSGAERRCA